MASWRLADEIRCAFQLFIPLLPWFWLLQTERPFRFVTRTAKIVDARKSTLTVDRSKAIDLKLSNREFMEARLVRKSAFGKEGSFFPTTTHNNANPSILVYKWLQAYRNWTGLPKWRQFSITIETNRSNSVINFPRDYCPIAWYYKRHDRWTTAVFKKRVSFEKCFLFCTSEIHLSAKWTWRHGLLQGFRKSQQQNDKNRGRKWYNKTNSPK